MRKMMAIVMAIICLFSLLTVEAFAYEVNLGQESLGYKTTVISGEEAIRQYLAECGEPYDPNLVEVIRIEEVTTSNVIPAPDGDVSPNFIIQDPYATNVVKEKYTDYNITIAEFPRPSGVVELNETVTISHTYTASAGITAEILESELGVEVSGSGEFSVKWSETYPYSVIVTVHPRYEKITGEIWDKDVQFDDYIGNFTVKRAIGDDVRVTRQY